MITKNHRIMVSQSDHKRWHLHIRDVQESDQGTYMCQINTDPMISQVGNLDVVSKYIQFNTFLRRAHSYVNVLNEKSSCIKGISVVIRNFKIKNKFWFSTVPPDILDYQTSTDMVVTEGNNVTLRCAAKGSPVPNITWRREDGSSIRVGNGSEGERTSIMTTIGTVALRELFIAEEWVARCLYVMPLNWIIRLKWRAKRLLY